MDFQYYGANCVRITTKKASIVVDDNLQSLGLRSVLKAGDVALYTGEHGVPEVETRLIVDQPGEYEVASISIRGVAARAHIDEEGTKNANVYRIVAEDVRIAVVGHIYPELNDDQLESLGTIDVLLIPVGGFGYTLDAIGALKLIKKIEPKLVIPTHFADKAINYPMPQAELTEALKGLAMEPKETTSKLKIKAGELSEITQLVVLERQ